MGGVGGWWSAVGYPEYNLGLSKKFITLVRSYPHEKEYIIKMDSLILE